MKSYFFLLIFSLLICVNAWSRGGGGCFEQGTLISTPKDFVPIEKLKVGDQVYSRDKNKRQLAKVMAITKVNPDHYLIIKLPKNELHVTDEHLIATKFGIYRRAAHLKPNDPIIIWQNNEWQSVNIIAITRLNSHVPAYNLLVDAGSTYIANKALVHNKGCFLPETPILRADGSSLAISQIKPGDQVKAYESTGKFMTTTVRAVLKHSVDLYYIITTDKVMLNVTGEHPFYTGKGTFKTVESLSIGDIIYGYDNKKLTKQRINSIKPVHAHTTVYNLQTDEPHTYFAAGIAVHNKGGGGGGHSSSSSNHCVQDDAGCEKTSEAKSLLYIAMMLCFIFGIDIVIKRMKKKRALDYLHSRTAINCKSIETMKLLDYLAKQDHRMDPNILEQHENKIGRMLHSLYTKNKVMWDRAGMVSRARLIFTQVHLALEAGRLDADTEKFLCPDVRQQIKNQLNAWQASGTAIEYRNFCVRKVEIVLVKNDDDQSKNEFTARISAHAKTIHLKNGSVTSQDDDIMPFVKYWEFSQVANEWKLKKIEL